MFNVASDVRQVASAEMHPFVLIVLKWLWKQIKSKSKSIQEFLRNLPYKPTKEQLDRSENMTLLVQVKMAN